MRRSSVKVSITREVRQTLSTIQHTYTNEDIDATIGLMMLAKDTNKVCPLQGIQLRSGRIIRTVGLVIPG